MELLQATVHGLYERFKARVARRAVWWFRYTELNRLLSTQIGLHDEPNFILKNSADTYEMAQQFNSLPDGDREVWREAHGVDSGPAGIILESLYREKRIDVLLRAAQAIRESLPTFDPVLVGAGPQQVMVRAFCKANPWAHFLGTREANENVQALAAADAMRCPEIGHLRHRYNGSKTPADIGRVGAGRADLASQSQRVRAPDHGLQADRSAVFSDQHGAQPCRRLRLPGGAYLARKPLTCVVQMSPNYSCWPNCCTQLAFFPPHSVLQSQTAMTMAVWVNALAVFDESSNG